MINSGEFVSAPAPEQQKGDGDVMRGVGLGRLLSSDSRDASFPMSAVLPRSATSRTRRFWNQNQWWGDQGNMPHCVAFAWLHYIEDGPVTHKQKQAPLIVPRELYCQAQSVDEWDGDCANPRYNGTSVRAGAKVLQRMGLLSGYRWAWDLDTMVQGLLNLGPVVVGTWWYESMFYPTKSGEVRIHGRRAGGHAFLANGVNTETKMIRFKNSWGRTWGKRGNFWMSFDDVARLIYEDGEVCIADEITSDVRK